MLIQHKEGKTRGKFFIEEDGEVLAEIVYAPAGENTIVIEHTEVDDRLKGQNIGYELVHHTVEYARTQGLKVSPVCTFAKAVFDKKPDFGDVLV
ncbi:MAG TPA: GNAT family N-acetyltransferase [Flavisolibacter sp.]|nr:GNAT family N-acetyltransferase [Flavisolibacter sp.]